MKTVTAIGAIRLFPTFFFLLAQTTTCHVSIRTGYGQIYMMILFVICVRLPEILYQKTLQPTCPGISGVRQLYQLIAIELSPFLPISGAHPFSSRHRYSYPGLTETRGFSKRSTNKSILNVHNQSPCCVVYRLYNKRMENNS